MDALLPTLAFVAACIAAFCFYCGAPRQQWLARPWPARPSRLAGSVLMLAALLLWMRVMHPSAAFFTLLTVAMALFVALPYLAAWRQLLRKRAQA